MAAMTAADSAQAGERVAAEPGKRVSWVELYLDLVFVLGVGQLAHVIVSDPTRHSVWVALGLFVALWWTWVGFAVQYNRQGADEPLQRLLFLVVAAALWWIYFDSAADINLKVLELSGGSPTMARAIFAVGHQLPAFALLLIASGIGLLIEDDPPKLAYWLACIGIEDVLSPHGYLWLLTGWVVMWAALATRTPGRDDAEAVARYLGRRRARA
jgi:low temperature requirement protein LtrA